MQYLINIDEEKVKEQIVLIVDDIFKREIERRGTDTQDVFAIAIKEMIYSRKDEIIDKVVNKATKEIVKKGLPRLIDRINTDE